jgi:hypothetical protein
VDNGYDSDLYESNADNPDGKDHEVDQRQNRVSNDEVYGTMMLLTEVAFDMPVTLDVAEEIILTHALHNHAEVQGPMLGLPETVPLEPEQEEPMAEPAAPIPMESPDLEPDVEVAKVLVESCNDHLATTAIAPGLGLH